MVPPFLLPLRAMGVAVVTAARSIFRAAVPVRYTAAKISSKRMASRGSIRFPLHQSSLPAGPRFLRSPVEMSFTMDSLMPMHSAAASALMTSLIDVSGCGHGWVTEDRLSMEDCEVEGELHQDFPCPYCYEDHDQSSLCAHLEDEHPFEAGVTACPICSVKVAGDLLNHITTQHKHQFKMQKHRPLRRVAIPSGQVLSLMGRDLREAHLQLLLASGLQSSNNDAPASVPDSLLSSLVLNFPTSEAEEIPKPTIPMADDTPNDTPKSSLTSKTWKYCSEPSLTSEEREQKAKQAAVRASFVQSLLLSTLFDN